MATKRNGSQPSNRGPADSFTGCVRCAWEPIPRAYGPTLEPGDALLEPVARPYPTTPKWKFGRFIINLVAAGDPVLWFRLSDFTLIGFPAVFFALARNLFYTIIKPVR